MTSGRLDIHKSSGVMIRDWSSGNKAWFRWGVQIEFEVTTLAICTYCNKYDWDSESIIINCSH